MTISIIIPTLNRPGQLLKLFERLNLIVTTEEVIVVDDSKASFEDKLRAIASFNLSYIHRGVKLGVSSARNIGAASAKGEYLLFFDDDDGFNDQWLPDFRTALLSNPELIFCNMQLIEANGEVYHVTVNDNMRGAIGNGIVIPGAWIIAKLLFINVGGYDERLLYSENTELFMRVNKSLPTTIYISGENLIYKPSPMGGSKNLQNMIDSLLIILEKHQNTLSSHVKYLYHQIIGVNYMRFQNFSEARNHLLKAISYKPYKPGTFARLCISLIPPLARKLYPKEVKL